MGCSLPPDYKTAVLKMAKNVEYRLLILAFLVKIAMWNVMDVTRRDAMKF